MSEPHSAPSTDQPPSGPQQSSSSEGAQAGPTEVRLPEIDKDKVDVLKFLAESAWREFDRRRSYEWKANFGLWLGLGAFAGFAIDQGLRSTQQVLAVSVLVLVGIAYTFIWTRGMYTSNRADKRTAAYYYSQIEKQIPGIDTHPFEASYARYREYSGVGRVLHSAFGALTNWSHLAQVLITWLLIILAAVAVGLPL